MGVNFFYLSQNNEDLVEWKNHIVNTLKMPEWKETEMKRLLSITENMINLFSKTEESVIKRICEDVKNEKIDFSDSIYFENCFNDCEKEKSIHFPVIRITFMLFCIFSYMMKKEKSESTREKYIYDLSQKQIFQRILALLDDEVITNYYDQQDNKMRLFPPVVKKYVKSWKKTVADEIAFIATKYYFELDGKKYWAKSDKERQNLIDKYAKEYVLKCDIADYYRKSVFHYQISLVRNSISKRIGN